MRTNISGMLVSENSFFNETFLPDKIFIDPYLTFVTFRDSAQNSMFSLKNYSHCGSETGNRLLLRESQNLYNKAEDLF